MGALTSPSAQSVSSSAAAANIMLPVATEDFPGAITALTQIEPDIQGNLYQGSNDGFPAFLIGWGPDWLAVFVAGAVNLALCRTTVQGWIDGTGVPALAGFVNTFADTLSEALRAKIANAGVGSRTRQVFVGHSLGGMVAQTMALRRDQEGGGATSGYVTFGQPKPGNLGLAQRARFIQGVRWFQPNDPIPLLPFTLEDTLSIVRLYPPNQLSAFGEACQWAGGLEINDDGTYRPEVLPTAVDLPAIASVVSYFLGWEQQGAGIHSMARYRRSVNRAFDLSRSPQRILTPVSPSEEPIDTSRQQLSQAEQRVVTTVSAAQRSQNDYPLNIPSTRLFGVVREGRLYLITFNGQNVGMTSDRRTARSLARQFNTALRHLQTTAFVDSQALQAQMENYLQAAADAGAGFTPPMNTNLAF